MSKRFKLYATIKETAGRELTYKSTRHLDNYNHALFLLRGKEVKIETKYLFLDQLNTAPVKGVTEIGLRLYFTDIKSLRMENRTFRTIKQRIKKFYANGWNTNIKDNQFSGWKYLLGLN